jgi:nucleotide-binding universal stress UspA family protein
MAFRNILVHLDRHPPAVPRLEMAIALARRFDARLLGLFALANPNMPSFAANERAPIASVAALEAEIAFRYRTTAVGIDGDWRADPAASDREITRQIILAARAADLTILGQFEPATADGSVPPDLVELTVLGAGRPVLVLPFVGRFDGLGRRAVIAWNGSRESARAVADALPLLKQADDVSVLSLGTDGGRRLPPASIDGIVGYLGRHAIAAHGERLIFTASDIGAADRLLSHLTDAGADLLVMGAAGRGGGRSAGASLTARVLAQLTVPLLLSY